MKFRTLAVVLTGIASVLVSAPLSGQQALSELRRGQRVRVVTPGPEGQPAQVRTGKVLRVGADTVLLVRSGNAPFPDERVIVTLNAGAALEISRGPRLLQKLGLASLGLLLGGAVGVPANACPDPFDFVYTGPPCDANLLGPFLGMTVGFAVGWVVASTVFPEQWERVGQKRLRVDLAPLPVGRLGLGASFNF